jgi:hypothetical protein
VAGRPGRGSGGGWLTLRDLCDLAYVLQVEQLERRVLAGQHVAAIAASVGAKDVEIPDPDKIRAEFDAMLIEEPKMVDSDELALRRRLRVA